MDAARIAADLDAALRRAGTPERAANERRYLKSDLDHYGVSMGDLRSLARGVGSAHPDLDRGELLALVEALWSEPVHERRMLAAVLLERHQTLLEAADADLLERLLRQSRTWALVDGLAASVAGPLVARHPELGATLDRWAEDGDFWIRRSALLALLGPLRAGRGDFTRFARYADAMLEEREFFVRKAIGWVLRETGKRRPELVAAWLAPRTGRASGVTVREAVKYLAPDDATRLLDAYREGRAARLTDAG